MGVVATLSMVLYVIGEGGINAIRPASVLADDGGHTDDLAGPVSRPVTSGAAAGDSVSGDELSPTPTAGS